VLKHVVHMLTTVLQRVKLPAGFVAGRGIQVVIPGLYNFALNCSQNHIRSVGGGGSYK
jgi:hypothetical protein